MFLARRTVQTHISYILAKLGAKGRVDTVGEALRRTSPRSGDCRDDVR